MQWSRCLRCLLTIAAMVGGLAGCARSGRVSTSSANSNVFPFALNGEDTTLRLDFASVVVEKAVPHRLVAGEVCVLAIGSATIECFADGSLLRLGREDGIKLLDENPLWRFRPAAHDKDGAKLLKLYAMLFLVGGSIERLPQALENYLEDEGPHRADVIDLARQLVIEGGAELPARAAGGYFLVTFRLTEDGRDKLEDALQSIKDETGVEFARALPSERNNADFSPRRQQWSAQKSKPARIYK